MFIVAIVGNAAEHWVAVLVAAKDKMDLAVNIAIGSSAQIALFVAPVLVLASFVVGPNPMALVFSGYELGGLLFAVIANLVTQEGESNWFEVCSCCLCTPCSGWSSTSPDGARRAPWLPPAPFAAAPFGRRCRWCRRPVITGVPRAAAGTVLGRRR